MGHSRVLLMLPCELERKALVARLSVDAPEVDVWYFEEGVGFVPANPQLTPRSPNSKNSNLLVCDLSRPEQASDITAAVLFVLLLHADLSLLCLLPGNRFRLMCGRDYATSLDGVVNVIRSTSQRWSPHSFDLTDFPLEYFHSTS